MPFCYIYNYSVCKTYEKRLALILLGGAMARWFSRIGFCLKLGGGYVRLLPQLVRGGWYVAALPRPIVSIFGGSRFKEQTYYFDRAYEAGNMLVGNNISVITGGGPGIMEAANCGASSAAESRARTMGIGVTELGDEKLNTCATYHILTDYFAIRKHLLIRYSLGFIVFPGGFGTLDELAEVLTLMQTNKLPVAPVVLIGAEYWSNLFAWVNVAYSSGLLPEAHKEYITITDNISYACSKLISHCKTCVKEPLEDQDS